jgi:hypothetical protein
VRRIALLVVAVVLVSSIPTLWVGFDRAGREAGNLTRGLPLIIAASAVSISGSSMTPLAYLSPLLLDRIEFS